MPLQTRSKAAAAGSDKPRASSREGRESATREMQPSHAEADMSQRAEQPTAGGRIASSPIVGSLPEAPEYDSPRARSRERNARDAEGTEWQERGRTFRLPPASSQDHLFSPPPYQNDSFHQHQKRSHQKQHQQHQMDYDGSERRDYDMDLAEVRDQEIMGGDEDDTFFFPSFAESPGRRSPEMDQGSERKRSAQPNQPRRSPPYYPHPQTSYTPSSQSRRSPPDSSASQQYPHPQPPHSYEGHPSQHPPHMYHYAPYRPPLHHGSPAPSNFPRSSPPGSGMSGGYYQGYSPYYHYPPHPSEHWDPRHAPPYPPPFEHDEDQIPPPPPSSSKKRSNPSLMGHEPDQEMAPDSSPEKEELKRGSPFRSPPTSIAKHKFRRSPFYHASPHIGNYGSFGLDTPRGALESGFSPMPEFSTFNDETTPLPIGDENYKLSISRSASVESDTPLLDRRPNKDPGSPLAGFMRELSPLASGIQGVPRSPLRHTSGYPGEQSASARDRSHAPPKGMVTISGARGAQNARLMGSPMESSSGAKPRKLWPTVSGPSSASATPSHPAVRVELGRTGSSTRKTLEGINTMLQSRDAARRDTTARVGYPARSQQTPLNHPGQHMLPPPRGYHGDIATPIKPIGHPGNPRMTPVRPSYPQPHGSAVKSAYMESAPGYTQAGSGLKTPYDPSRRPPYAGSDQKPSSAQKVPPSSGKENKKKSPSSKRSPCNCKKSKCLKLYCECFAAERFCDGCNCNDCGNTAAGGLLREKAIKDTRAKNPNAFKPRIGKPVEVVTLTVGTPLTGHNMGCRCKRSECLKKYCECFQAGVICSSKCKCVDCLNYAGSQALIDKRRKIKDQRGADFAMRVADEAWKGQPGSARKPIGGPPSAVRRIPPPIPSPARGRLPHPSHMMHPSPRGPPPSGGPHHHHYMMMGPPMGPMGFSPMGVPMTPAGYPNPPHMPPGEHHHHGMYPPPPGHPGMLRAHQPPRPQKKVAPKVTPRTPGVRVQFDPASSRKKRKLSPGTPEPTLPYFGAKLPEQPKTTALAIFSFLSNDDLYNAGLVCKKWTQLAMDEELWKFQS